MKIYDFILLILIILILNLIIFNLSYKEGITSGKPGGNTQQLIETTNEKLKNDPSSVTATTQFIANNIKNTTVGVSFGLDKVEESVELVNEMTKKMGLNLNN